MSAQIGRDQNFPAACKRCGGLLYENFEICPYCGTDCPLDKVSLGTHPKATMAPLDTTAAAPPSPAAAKMAPAGAPAPEGPSLNTGYPHAGQHTLAFAHGLRSPHIPQWIFPRGVFVVALILVFAYGTYMLLGTNHQRDGTASEETLHSSGGSVSASAPAQQADETPPAADTGTSAQTSPPTGTQHSPPPDAHAAPQFADVADGLRVARASLAQNNLFDAKAAANAVLARDANNEEAHAIQSDIAAREQRRDNALQAADHCVGQGAWACVQQQASEALAIDSSSQAAQSFMQRAIVSTAWKPLNSPNAAPHANAATPTQHGANAVRLPSSQDWSTSASPPPLPSAMNPTNTTNAANPTNTANAANAANVATPASNDNSAEAQERAIVQNGWKHTAPPGAAH
ncbi:hypothetical protein [Paraburkholderia sp. JHI869]|uniref:hypothetical protein n=1 Tax=Paraburkholderia sp. JHI869 TaxID=3112959 RepID=UPI00317DEC06